MRDFYGNTFFLPDKWKTNFYSKDFLLDVSGKTEVGIPDSLFGNAILDFSSTVLLANSDNESQNFNFNFTYDASHDDFRLKLNGDTVVAEYYCMSQPDNSRKAVLTSYFGESEIEKKEVSLPFQEKLNYAATSYRLQSVDGEELRRIATPAKILKLVYFKGKRTCDSISISLHNELQIPVSYQVFRETTKIDGGRSSSYAWATSDKSIDSYYVIYTFRWQDRDYTLERSFHIMEKELQVRINQPEVIYPGAQIPVSIHVSDYKNQPMEDVNLTAWSVNMQFEEIPLPAMPYFGKVHYELLAPFTTYATALSADGKRPINRKYIDLIHLRETPFYNLIYADNGVGIEYDSINSTWAEFAPFVYSKKRNRQIYTIYLDNEPVYIYGTNYTPPFSFKVKPGTYEVKLRTIDNLFTIRNVTIKPGVKSFVCLNVDSAYANANVSYVSLKDSSFYMQSEQELLKKYILLLDPIGVKEVFLEQDSLSTAFKKTYNEKKLYINDFGGYFKLGPIKKGLINITNQRNDTAYSFYFEPGYLYSLHDDSTYFDQPILYPNPLTGIVFSEREIPWNFNDQSIEVPVIIKEKYEASDNEYISEKRTYKPRHPLLKKYSQKGSYLSENCRLKFMFPKGAKIEWMGLFNHENDSATSVVFRKDDDFSDLKPGKYDVFIFYEDSSYYLLKNHELLADGINYVRYDTTLINGYDQEITDYYEKEVIRLNKPPLKKFTTPPHIFGKENVEVSYSRTPDGSTMISGYYLDYHGMPENNAIIYAEIQGIFKAGAVTNEEGYFEIHNVPAGNYMFNIHYYDSRP
ncbi:MAG: carboxypeptidase-like regulatory domain-containing protein, partial [Bacteroidetes bacterium]|nr:carboxypeptidase-like regulatory domain-containing protein [Bacteroidota bacterium]